MLTTHLLITNNEKTIAATLESLSSLRCNIVVGNMGSCDKTPQICLKYGAEVIDIGQKIDLSKVRNSLMGPEWNMYLHPWEILASGHEEINNVSKDSSYYFPIYKNNIVTHEIRLWKNIKFCNPIYETISSNTQNMLPAIVYSKNAPYYFDNVLERIKEWRSHTMAHEAIYYEAFALLENRKFEEFAVLSEHYLSLDARSMSSIMMRYYLSAVQLKIFKDASKSVRNVMTCIVHKPLMAEFWCLLGDIYYQQKRYKKSKSFYENAIFLGSKRLNSDIWPIEIDKYHNYPTYMIANIEKILCCSNSK